MAASKRGITVNRLTPAAQCGPGTGSLCSIESDEMKVANTYTALTDLLLLLEKY